MTDITIYGDTYSGHCEKVQFIAAYLKKPCRWIHTDIVGGKTRTPEFLAINPAGELPVMLLPDGRKLVQSNAILLFLADGTPLILADPFDRGLMHQWLFWEQLTHNPAIGMLRFLRFLLKKPEDQIDPTLAPKAERALATMDAHLQNRTYFVAERLSVADIALVAYTRLAEQGGMPLAPAVRRWVQRVEVDLGLESLLSPP